MGERGPKPLPKNVLLLRGSRLASSGANDVVEPEVAIPGCPKHLLPEARKCWRRLTPELEKLGLIAKIDQMALSLVCQEWAWYVWHDTALQRNVKLAAEKCAAFEANEARKVDEAAARGDVYTPQPWSGGNGFQMPTPNGSFTYNPHWVARNKHSQQLDKYLASFGLSPSSRGRVTPSSRQASLPGFEAPTGGFSAL